MAGPVAVHELEDSARPLPSVAFHVERGLWPPSLADPPSLISPAPSGGEASNKNLFTLTLSSSQTRRRGDQKLEPTANSVDANAHWQTVDRKLKLNDRRWAEHGQPGADYDIVHIDRFAVPENLVLTARLTGAD